MPNPIPQPADRCAHTHSHPSDTSPLRSFCNECGIETTPAEPVPSPEEAGLEDGARKLLNQYNVNPYEGFGTGKLSLVDAIAAFAKESYERGFTDGTKGI